MFDTDERPLALVWEVTRACELACDHCRAEATPSRHPDELTTAEGKALLDDVARFGDGQPVVLSGGDPLKRDDLVELVDHGDDLGLRVGLTPSGTASITRERLSRLADAGLARFALSLDGPTAEAHDAFRGESGSFAETVAAAADAAAVGLDLQVNTTVCGRTVEELPELAETVADVGATRWVLFFLVPVGRGRRLDGLSPGRADEVLSWADDLDRDFAVSTTEAPQFRRVKLARAGREPPTPDGEGDANGPGRRPVRPNVLAGDGFMFINHVGDVTPSGFLPKRVGNVREDDPVALYREADLFRSLRDREALSGKCGACEYRWVCGGSRSRAFAATGDPLGSDPLCPYVPEGYDGPLPWEGDGEGGVSPLSHD
ncbi:MAG: TIGR04053 family radical SAM/SPASM domain-containing protein [Halolamina sp.]